MSVFVLENKTDGYENWIEGVYSSFEKVLDVLKQKHPDGEISESKPLITDGGIKQWTFEYYPFKADGDGWENHYEWYTITEYEPK